MKRSMILAGIAVTLMGCGGGSEEASSVESVAGSFKFSADTGVYYSPDYNGVYDAEYLGEEALPCEENRTQYYETENVYVFGNPDLPDSDFETAANWVESYFQDALDVMGITKEEFYAERTHARFFARNHFLEDLVDLKDDPSSSFGEFTLPTDILETRDTEDFNFNLYEWAVTLATYTDAQTVMDTVIEEANDFDEYSSLNIDDKIYVCLHEGVNDNYWGEGTYAGIVIAAPSVNPPSDASELITHELIHTIQLVFTMDATLVQPLPRWWLEGQATYLSGMGTVAKNKHDEYDPTLVIYSFDETYVDDAYGHYALAYQYLEEANGRETLVNFMSELKALVTNIYSDENPEDIEEYLATEDYQFTNLFNATMVDMDGNPLTVEQWRNNYHSYIEDWSN
ncbi:hypothetical protein [Alteromonas sp. C1M14]|uniref:hypothetical protein n=1 Tax=Alteromonas sp. C1M14 TaxID=2841567 RepID=UPI001C09ED69|nr:hypothetical protein [Alteromonas sp. C1M14]MBU2978184.1 hypothetical protein [Alteromonas sp. C1M14]